MNPGPTLGMIAVFACYTVVLGSLLIYMKLTSSKRKKLDARRKELLEGE